ncbi:hypothetical protein DFH09DRAFT_1111569 [Mycena vulgaris]|nr:hypothetical protein DFH09DRAFT_1111569 [Mycena vulgaris]
MPSHVLGAPLAGSCGSGMRCSRARHWNELAIVSRANEGKVSLETCSGGAPQGSRSRVNDSRQMVGLEDARKRENVEFEFSVDRRFVGAKEVLITEGVVLQWIRLGLRDWQWLNSSRGLDGGRGGRKEATAWRIERGPASTGENGERRQDGGSRQGGGTARARLEGIEWRRGVGWRFKYCQSLCEKWIEVFIGCQNGSQSDAKKGGAGQALAVHVPGAAPGPAPGAGRGRIWGGAGKSGQRGRGRGRARVVANTARGGGDEFGAERGAVDLGRGAKGGGHVVGRGNYYMEGRQPELGGTGARRHQRVMIDPRFDGMFDGARENRSKRLLAADSAGN